MSRTRTAVRDTATALTTVFGNPGLRRVNLALAGSLIGDWAFATAVTVWVYGVGGAAAVGAYMAVRLLLMAVGSAFIAGIADRVSRKLVMVTADLVRAVLVAAAAALIQFGSPPAPVFVVAVVVGLVGCAFRPAQAALMPSLARSPAELTAANGAASTLESLSFFVGPALGALLLTVADVPVVFAFNALTFVWSAAFVAAIPAPRPRPEDEAAAAPEPEPAEDEDAGFWRESVAGFRQILGNGDLLLVTALASAQTVVAGASAVFTISIAVGIVDLGPEGVGYLDAVLGIGAVLGGLVAISRSGRQRLGFDFGVGVLLWSVPILAVAVWPHPVAAFAAMVAIGIGNPLVDVNFYTILQRLVPEHVMGRVFGATEAAVIAAMALGAALMPVLIAAMGLRWALAVLGASVAVVAAAGMTRLSRLDAGLREPAGLGLLRRVPVFAPLRLAVLESLAHRLGRVEVPAGGVVIREGAAGDRFYIVESGLVEATYRGVALSRSGPGEPFGEIALLQDIPRTASVTAVEPTVLLTLDRADFLAALSGSRRAHRRAELLASRRIPTG